MLELVVSILVVLDWRVLEHDSLEQNPSFVEVYGFQSLLYWIGCWNVRRKSVDLAAMLSLRFQSLLYWIGCWNRDPVEPPGLQRVGFNPCCIGLGAGTPWLSVLIEPRHRCVSILVVLDWVLEPQPDRRRPPSSACVSILVVLDWVLEPSPGADAQGLARSGFNPCCIGLGAGTWEQFREWRKPRTFGFNPCCIGLGAGTGHIDSRPRTRCVDSCFNPCCIGLGAGTVQRYAVQPSSEIRFQSLLYWIGCWNTDDVMAGRRHSRTSFQSCCIGLGAGTCTAPAEDSFKTR